MTKKNFITLILSTIGGILFALGMCMALLPEWNVFNDGIIIGSFGAIVLLVMLLVRRKMEGKPLMVKLTAKTIFTILLGVIGTVAFGVGMCMVMVWDMILYGILVGIVGIILLICLIPLCKGLK